MIKRLTVYTAKTDVFLPVKPHASIFFKSWTCLNFQTFFINLFFWNFETLLLKVMCKNKTTTSEVVIPQERVEKEV